MLFQRAYSERLQAGWHCALESQPITVEYLHGFGRTQAGGPKDQESPLRAWRFYVQRAPSVHPPVGAARCVQLSRLPAIADLEERHTLARRGHLAHLPFSVALDRAAGGAAATWRMLRRSGDGPRGVRR